MASRFWLSDEAWTTIEPHRPRNQPGASRVDGIFHVLKSGCRWCDCPTDKGYDADPLRRTLRKAGAVPVIPGRASRKHRVRYDREGFKDRHLIENAFRRLKDFRRVATHYDKLGANFLSGGALATVLAFWL